MASGQDAAFAVISQHTSVCGGSPSISSKPAVKTCVKKSISNVDKAENRRRVKRPLVADPDTRKLNADFSAMILNCHQQSCASRFLCN